MKLANRIQDFAARRARYHRTLRELRAMSADVARDLDIDRAAARRIARQAVYGA